MELENRIIELEARQAFQDDTIQALNDVLVEQQRLVDRLQVQVGMLARRQEDLQGRVENGDDEAPPPHY